MAHRAERGCRYSIGVTLQKPVLGPAAQIPEHAWQRVEDYPETGICESPRPRLVASG